MRILIIPALAGSIALAGCQTIDTIDSYIKQYLPIACSGLELANTAFFIAHGARPFGPTILASQAALYAKGKNICAHPETATTVTVVTTVLELAIQINGYIRQAERAGVE